MAPLSFRALLSSTTGTVSAKSSAPRIFLLLAVPALFACGDGDGAGNLPARPELLEPASGAQLNTDTPTFVVRNAASYDQGQATYTFRVAVASTDRFVASQTVTAGTERTAALFPFPLLRGATLAWRVTARNNSGTEVTSESSTFRLPAVQCQTSSDRYAKTVTDSWISACSLSHNVYNNTQEVLGSPNARGNNVTGFFGFLSLGDGGYVGVDMQACAQDRPGPDVRVFQSVSGEEVTLYASSTGTGPWVLVDSRVFCGNDLTDLFSNYCDFDLSRAGLEEARYFKVEDGELFPCPGGTNSEGADIDAVQILNLKP